VSGPMPTPNPRAWSAPSHWRRWRGAAIAGALVAIIAYGAILRADVLTRRYGPFQTPAVLRTLNGLPALAAPILPPGFVWYHEPRPYVGGDPVNYLRFAREMRSFYQGHVREPVFLALTRAWLWLTGGADVSVSLASSSASLLAIGATFLLGALFSPWIGLLAAFALAVDFDAVSWSADGWRDDTFTLIVTLAAWTFVRLRRVPARGNAVAAGTAAAAACLTRITAVSFVLPAALWLVLDGSGAERRARLRATALALAVAAVLIAPYLINSAREMGDPLIAINAHTRYYRAAEGVADPRPQSAAAYIAHKIEHRPVSALDTAATGLFVLPVENKGAGFGFWWRRLPSVLHLSMVAGLFLLCVRPDGRLLAVVAVTSVLPYALTWNLGGGAEWRFTMHVYPVLLVAAAAAVTSLVPAVLAIPVLWRRRRVPPARGLAAVAAVGLLAVAAVMLYDRLPWLVAREAIAAGDSTTVGAGPRDRIFFRSGWLPPASEGNVTARLSDGARATVHLPLVPARRYRLVVRADPVLPDRPASFAVLLNRHLLGHIRFGWDPLRVGSYPMAVPPQMVASASSELTLVADSDVLAGDAGTRYASLDPGRRIAFRLWYVRVIPLPDAAHDDPS
jgi:hypothetical protein